ncbi:MAG TPA: glutathione synthetase [Acidimicrobiia bacterium]|nr:glutathione synthetase [Acidimicrobiia bacterium]
MKVGFVVNQVGSEKPQYTTTRLAMSARNLGHEVWLIGVGDLAQGVDGKIIADAAGPGKKSYRSLTNFLEDVQSEEKGANEKIVVDELDVLMLRNDPSEDAIDRPWAQTSGILFGQVAAAHGVLVVNDPVHLADAVNKTYFQHFPEEVRPQTLISRNESDIREFIQACKGKAVLKPLQGSGGQGVFLVAGDQNVNQMIETLIRDGYIVAQEYLKNADEGDVRLFVMNGEPLVVDGQYAAFRRVPSESDVRSNMHVGGEAVAAKVTDKMLTLVDMVKPKLIQDGMFLVGLDIVGDKLMEVNVFSPGGLGSAGNLSEIDFARPVIEALEHKVRLRAAYGPSLPNVTLATL